MTKNSFALIRISVCNDDHLFIRHWLSEAHFIAQHKKKVYYYIHQNSSQKASTYWLGNWAVKCSTFLMLNGFDIQYYQGHSIEDTDLGYRIKQAKGEIFTAKDAQVKDHKAWISSLIKTNILARGIPWIQLLLSQILGFVNNLNFIWDLLHWWQGRREAAISQTLREGI